MLFFVGKWIKGCNVFWFQFVVAIPQRIMFLLLIVKSFKDTGVLSRYKVVEHFLVFCAQLHFVHVRAVFGRLLARLEDLIFLTRLYAGPVSVLCLQLVYEVWHFSIIRSCLRLRQLDSSARFKLFALQAVCW
jgi:hypothetical protein